MLHLVNKSIFDFPTLSHDTYYSNAIVKLDRDLQVMRFDNPNVDTTIYLIVCMFDVLFICDDYKALQYAIDTIKIGLRIARQLETDSNSYHWHSDMLRRKLHKAYGLGEKLNIVNYETGLNPILSERHNLERHKLVKSFIKYKGYRQSIFTTNFTVMSEIWHNLYK